MTIDSENKKLIREKLNCNIIIPEYSQYRLDYDEIISFYADLRSVETTVNNPSMQFSEVVLEIVPKSGVDWFFQRFRGEDITIQYQAGYSEDYSETRTFYANLNDDNFKLNNGTISITATDYASKVGREEHDGALLITSQYTSSTLLKLSLKPYMYEILKPYMPDLVEPVPGDTSATGVYENIPNCSITNYNTDPVILIEKKPKTELLSQFMNIFRGTYYTGSASQSEQVRECRKKFVFRDAGRPEAGWSTNSVTGASSSINIQTFEMEYNQVADFKSTSFPVCDIWIDNPIIDISATVIDPASERTGYKYLGTMDIVQGNWYEYTTSEPYADFDWPQSVTYTENVEMLSPYAVKFKAKATGTIKIHGIPAREKRNTSNIPSVQCNFKSKGNKVQLNPFKGLNFGQTNGGFLYNLFDRRRPDQVWYEFKWRGNPHMQPNDLVLFTEKDGTQNYYEIERVSFEHKEGGLISEMKMRRIFESAI